MLNDIKIAAQYCLPKHAVSRLVGKLAAAETGALTTLLIKAFIKRYKVEMTEAEQPDPASYSSFNAFFTRPLAADARFVVDDAGIAAMPVDGAVSQLGSIDLGRLFQAKGHDYSLLELLGGDKQATQMFDGGQFATIYLSPKDYHRIHMPLKGELKQMTYVPGELFSVNPLTVSRVPNLFARNERVITLFDTEIGPMALILVGATIVASIETVWAGTITPPRAHQIFRWRYDHHPIILDKGEEMGRFKLGSTVIALFPKGTVRFPEQLRPATTTRMGEAFAELIRQDKPE